MPVIAIFYGITVYMFFLDDRRHKMPHIHIQHGDDEAVIQIPDGEVLEGSLRRKHLRLVQAWIEIHQDELMQNWDRAINGRSVAGIEPLK
jgi:predicted esterase